MRLSLELIKENYPDQNELDQILGKILQITLENHQKKLTRYEQELQQFEEK